MEPAERESEDPPINWMMERSTLWGRVGMIVCWYWDGSQDESDERDAIRGVRLISKLLAGDTQRFSGDDWWIFLDAIGSYPDRDETLEELYEIARDGYAGELPAGPTKRFENTDWIDEQEPSEDRRARHGPEAGPAVHGAVCYGDPAGPPVGSV